MSKSVTYIFFLAILAVTIATNYWPESNKVSTSITPSSKADYFFKQVSVSQYNPDGALNNQLKAEKIEHFKHSQSSKITLPKITLKKSLQANWLISANTGLLNHTNNQLELNGTVLMQQLPQKNPISKTNQQAQVTKPILASIRTESLTFNLNNNSAHTRQTVEIITADSLTTADSLFADFATNQIKLKGQIKTQGSIDAPY